MADERPPAPTTTATAPPLDEAIAALLSSGVSIAVSTRNAALEPECAKGMGARVHRDRRTLTVYVPEALLHRTRENLLENGAIAVSFSRPRDDESMQVKGRLLALREPDARDKDAQDLYRGAYVEQLALVGVPRAAARRLRATPALAIDLEVTDVFLQTPGPRAGTRLRGKP